MALSFQRRARIDAIKGQYAQVAVAEETLRRNFD